MIASDGKKTKITDIQSKFGGTSAEFFVDKPKIIIKVASRGVSFSIPVTMRREENKPTKYSNKKAEFTYIFGATKGLQYWIEKKVEVTLQKNYMKY